MNFSALWPTKYASRPIDVAHAMPPSAFQNRKVGHDMRVDARHPRGGDAQPGDPAPEEDRLGPVAVEERLADRDDAAAVVQERPRGGQQPAAELAADREADVVAQDRRHGGDGDDRLDRQVPAAREDRGGDQRGLARHRDAHRLDGDEQEDDRQADVLGDVHEGREGRDHHSASSMLAVPALTITARDAGSRARAGRPAHRPRRGAHAGLRAAGDQGDGQGNAAGRGRGPRLRHRARQHLPPVPRPRPRAHRALRRPARLHGLERADRHRLGRLPGLLDGPRHGRRRDQGPHAARRPAPGRDRRHRGARRALSLLPRRLRALHGARDLDGDPGRAGLGPRARVRRVHAAQRRRATTPRARPSARTAGCAAAWTGTTSTAPTASSSTGSSRAASSRTCALESAQAVAASECDGIAIGGSLGADKAEMHAVVDWTTAALPEDRPRHLLGIGEIDDLVRGVELGIDTFDCAMPTRLGRHGMVARPRPRAAAGASTSARRAGRTPTSR